MAVEDRSFPINLERTRDYCQSFFDDERYNLAVPRKKKQKRDERPVFDSIRKPTAPPSRKFGDKTQDEKHLPSLRKAKHKKNLVSEDE